LTGTGSSRPTAHLVFKTHLDIGFTALASEVVDRYVGVFIPSALAVAAELRAGDGDERFVWTTGSWLIDTFLERADAAGRRAMEAGIAAGDIAWHALPFTLHSELCDRSLFEHGLSIAARLDARFGRRTIGAKLTDVPGHTRGIVPLLAAAGVEFLHIGVNPACPAPDVPPVFRWRSPDGAEVVVAYQRGGYGGAVVVDGLADSLVVAHTDDNRGPQTVEQVREVFARVRAEQPGADVQASTLDAFAVALRAQRDDLPVVTGELGDTWIHGVGTDPQKVARFRELSRLRARWIADGDDPAEPALARASTSLLLVAEHTWGLDEKTTLPDDGRYRADELAVLRREPAGRRFESSWAEQRDYVDDAIAALPSQRRWEAELVLAELGPAPREAMRALPRVAGETSRLGRYTAVIDETGGIRRLVDEVTGWDWASSDHLLGRYRYQTFSAEDYDQFHSGYNRAEPHDEWWAIQDYTKVGIAAAGAASAWWEPERVDVHDGNDALRVVLTMPSIPSEDLGCPSTVVLRWSVPAEGRGLDLTVEWRSKRACRLPEAGWLSFDPVIGDPGGWTMDKLGQDVSPLDVVSLGNRHLHAVGRGVRHTGPAGVLSIDTLDAPLVAPGEPRLLDPHDDQPDLAGGWHVNLHNNVWGTNFPMWNEGPASFRFHLDLPDGSA